MEPYIRTAHYHETDQMGVIHHSNYLKWLEEARIYFLDECGLSYRKMEEIGIISPVYEISLQYKYPVKFDETVKIYLELTKYTGVRFEFNYKIINPEGKVSVLAKSTHCLIKDNKVISVKKELPELHEKFMKLIEEYEKNNS